MPRDDGFTVADVDTGKHSDPKFKRLWRIIRDEAAMNAAVAVYEATQLESWAQGERVNAEDAAPFWMSEVAAPLAALREVGLLDKDGKIPAKAWESWFGAARDRRQKRRDAGQLGGRPPKRNTGDEEPFDNQTVSDALAERTVQITTDNPVPSVPSVPYRTDRSVPHAPSNARAGGLEPVGNVMADLDVLHPDSIPLDVRRLQRLAEELTGQAYAMNNLHSGYGKKAVAEQLPHGFDRVERAWRKIANQTKGEGTAKPTLRQLVLGADDILNPVPQQDSSEQREQAARELFDRRVARTQAELEETKKLMGYDA